LQERTNADRIETKGPSSDICTNGHVIETTKQITTGVRSLTLSDNNTLRKKERNVSIFHSSTEESSRLLVYAHITELDL
jgi:hypothetical protein